MRYRPPPFSPPGNFEDGCAAGLDGCLLHRWLRGYRRADVSLWCIFSSVFIWGGDGLTLVAIGGPWCEEAKCDFPTERKQALLPPYFDTDGCPCLQNRSVLRFLAHGGTSQNLPWDLELPSDFRNLGNCLLLTGTSAQCPEREA